MGILKIILRDARTLLQRLLTRVYNQSRSDTFFVFCCCGLIAVLIDFDHVISQTFSMGRPLHIPVLILLGVICCIVSAHIYRRVHNAGLGGKKCI